MQTSYDRGALSSRTKWNIGKSQIFHLTENQFSQYGYLQLKRDGNRNILRYKVRLYAKRFAQNPGIDYKEVYAPTTRYDSIRILLSLAVQNYFTIRQFDVETEFL